MREPEISGPQGDAWRVPLDRLRAWVDQHEGDVHPASRGGKFDAWNDLWMVRRLTPQDLDAMRADWVAVLLRDLTADPDIARWYREAEWEVVVLHCHPDFGTPPVNGEAMFEWDQSITPPILYQFHGLTRHQVLELGTDPRHPVTFAQLLVEAICQGSGRRDDETWSHRLSALVNGIRENGYGSPSRPPLEVAGRTGLLVSLDDGSSVSLPAAQETFG